MANNIVEVTDANFEQEVIEKSKEVPVVVDFWAAWCGPCVMLKPMLESIAKEYDGKFVLAKVDVSANQEVSQKFEVRSIPDVKMFKDGKAVSGFVGAIPEDQIKEWLDENL